MLTLQMRTSVVAASNGMHRRAHALHAHKDWPGKFCGRRTSRRLLIGGGVKEATCDYVSCQAARSDVLDRRRRIRCAHSAHIKLGCTDILFAHDTVLDGRPCGQAAAVHRGSATHVGEPVSHSLSCRKPHAGRGEADGLTACATPENER